MTAFSIGLIRILNSLFKPPKFISELDTAKLSIKGYQDWEYREIERISSEFGSDWNLTNTSVLDVGCGLGGKLVYYEKRGARQIVGFDIRFPSVRSGFELATEKNCTNIHFTHADSARLPYKSEYFDAIISVNVFEHVDDIRSTLDECKRVLRPGGLIFLHFPPFYGPWGAHLEGWINFPWPNVFFSDRTLLKAAQWIENNRTKKNDKYIPSAVVNWSKYEQLPDLNRTTIKSFQRLLNELQMKVKYVKLLPIGREYLKNKGLVGKTVLNILWFLTRIPFMNEIITTKMVFVLQK